MGSLTADELQSRQVGYDVLQGGLHLLAVDHNGAHPENFPQTRTSAKKNLRQAYLPVRRVAVVGRAGFPVSGPEELHSIAFSRFRRMSSRAASRNGCLGGAAMAQLSKRQHALHATLQLADPRVGARAGDVALHRVCCNDAGQRQRSCRQQ